MSKTSTESLPKNGNNGKHVIKSTANPRLFSTPEAEEIKKEICIVGKKLWMRQFVDGNGGNISYRIGPNEVICTPTLVSKFDLTPGTLEKSNDTVRIVVRQIVAPALKGFLST